MPGASVLTVHFFLRPNEFVIKFSTNIQEHFYVYAFLCLRATYLIHFLRFYIRCFFLLLMPLRKYGKSRATKNAARGKRNRCISYIESIFLSDIWRHLVAISRKLLFCCFFSLVIKDCGLFYFEQFYQHAWSTVFVVNGRTSPIPDWSLHKPKRKMFIHCFKITVRG